MIDLSNDQQAALSSLLNWFKAKKKRQFITLGGYAGTGKTTLISIFRRELKEISKDLKVAFVSYTGKAARVLDVKLREAKSIYRGDYTGTIHSLIYSPITNDEEEIVGWELKEEMPYDLIIIDEASMVDYKIWQGLTSFGVPIAAVGDHGQLPPISNAGKGKGFNLMARPDIRLERIHRQAADNPIIKLSIEAREKGAVPYGEFAEGVRKVSRDSLDAKEMMDDLLGSYNEETMVLCGFNFTRVKLNKFIREKMNFLSPAPQPGDRVICLRNNYQKQIFNGMLGTINTIAEEGENAYFAEIDMDQEDKMFRGAILQEQFGSKKTLNFTSKRQRTIGVDLFDFGYALTVHKAQGSQAKRVVLFEERFSKMSDDMWKRWLYTAVTRAEEELFIFGKD